VTLKIMNINDTEVKNESAVATSLKERLAEPPTVDLAWYYFSPDRFSTGFNWRSVAMTLDGWNSLSSGHYAYLAPDPQVLIIKYGKIDLWLHQGYGHEVVWYEQAGVLSGDPVDPGILTTTELPNDPIGLLRVLNLTAHPLADDVIKLWKDLVAFLPELDL
jgi:hypothetical protein